MVNVPVPVHSNTAQSAPPLIRSTRCDQSGKMASVSRATLCRSVVHGVTGSQKTPSAAKSAANSSGPCDRLEGAGPLAPSPAAALTGAASPARAAQALGLEGDDGVVEREHELGPDELVRLGHEADRRAPGREADGVAGEAHRALGDLHLHHPLTPGLQRRALHLLHGRLAGRVHGLGVVGQLDVLGRLLHGHARRAPGGVDEAGAEGETDRHPAGSLEQREVAGREVRDERHGLSGVGAPWHPCRRSAAPRCRRARRRCGACAPTPRTARPRRRARAPCRTPRAAVRVAWSTAASWASDASEIEPLPQFHTPTGTETTATPHTRSSGSQPAACSSSASSTDRSEVMPRFCDGGAAAARAWAPRSISARTSAVGARRRPRRASCRGAPWASGARPGRSP